MILEYIIISGGRRVMGNVRRIIGAFLIVFILIVFFMMKAREMSCDSKQTKQTSVCVETMAQKILRFHVLGNSDDKADQDVKLRVRDAVGKYIEPKLEESKDINTTRKIVNDNMDGIIETANSVLKENGFSYKATCRIKNTDFPEKTYGQYTFPEGEYEALQIVLGEGKGHNWWCVLYPNLCFVDAVYGVVEDEEKEKLENVLTEEEYQSILEVPEENVTVECRFIQWIQECFGIEDEGEE